MIAYMKNIAFFYSFVVDPHAFKVDAVGGSQIFNVINSVSAYYSSMLSGDVPVFYREIGCSGASTQNKLIFVHRISLILINEIKHRCCSLGGRLRCRPNRSGEAGTE